MAERQPVKERDIEQVVRYLSSTFNQATSKFERAARTKLGVANKAYIIQTEFAYMLSELMLSPRCMQQKYITDCNNLIDQIISLPA